MGFSQICNAGRMKLPRQYQTDGDDSYLGYCTFDQSDAPSIQAKKVQEEVKDTSCSDITVPDGTLPNGGCKLVADGGPSIGACYSDVAGAPWACIKEEDVDNLLQMVAPPLVRAIQTSLVPL